MNIPNHQLEPRLRNSGRHELSSEEASRIRHVLLREFDRVRSDGPIRTRLQGGSYVFTTRRLLLTAMVLMVFFFGLGTTTIANAAKPGDLLFGWDRTAERIRLSLTLGVNAKARYEVQVAEERFQEQVELENEHSNHADEAAVLTGVAIDRAITDVDEVKVQLEKNPGNNAEVVSNVDRRLRRLRDRHDDRNNRLKIETENKQGRTDENRVDNTNTEDQHEGNRNQNVNTDQMNDENANTVNPEDRVTVTDIHVRVDLTKRVTEIQINMSGQETEWQLEGIDQATILTSITARTGLSTTQVTDIWDFEQR